RSPKQVLQLRWIEIRRGPSPASNFLESLDHRGRPGKGPPREDPNRTSIRGVHVPIRKHAIAGKNLDAEPMAAFSRVQPAARQARTDGERRRNQAGPE